MLTKRQNLLETIRGGKPDRYVNQYEFMHFIFSDPFFAKDPYPEYGQENIKNGWGVTLSWPEGTPGVFPVHKPETTVLPDITEWKERLKMPSLDDYPEEDWLAAGREAAEVDRKEEFVTCMIAPGVFDMTHYLMGVEDALINFYEEPEALHEVIDYVTEFELKYAEKLCKYVKPDCIFHHDDWGSQISTFISPDLFEEFILPAYKKIYGYYKDHGVELIVHHSDSYAETLVPFMIEMGIDIWQGVMSTNNIPKIIEEFGGKITLMGGIDSAKVDFPGWTKEIVKEQVEKACEAYGTKYFIPCATQGMAVSTYEGVYEEVSAVIEEQNKKYFA